MPEFKLPPIDSNIVVTLMGVHRGQQLTLKVKWVEHAVYPPDIPYVSVIHVWWGEPDVGLMLGWALENDRLRDEVSPTDPLWRTLTVDLIDPILNPGRNEGLLLFGDHVLEEILVDPQQSRVKMLREE